MASKGRQFKDLIHGKQIVIQPGVYDGYTARLVEAAGFASATISGAGVSESRMGWPDRGIMTFEENLANARRLADCTNLLLRADADTGYGNAMTVYFVVRAFEKAGVASLMFEDQVWPKRCGAMNGKAVIDSREMCMKIEAAIKAKKDKDFVINARTDAIAVEGIEGAVRRAKEYAAAGADMIYPDAVRGEDDIKRILDAVPDTPVNINMGFGIRSRPTTPLVSVRRLGEMGVARVSCPRMLTAAAISGMKKALIEMRRSIETGEVADRPDLLASMDEIAELAGYERIDALEKEFTLKEDLERRYGEASVTYVVKPGEGQR